MSHFAGLVICTPKYLQNKSFEDALDAYDENKSVPEYVDGTVDDYEKISFIDWYKKDEVVALDEKFREHLISLGVDVKTYDEYRGERTDLKMEHYYGWLRVNNKDAWVAFFKENLPQLFDEFEALYEKHGEDWNYNGWRKNVITGVWERISTYNPKSRWDWYSIGGRWNCDMKTKSGEYVNECLFGELDFKPFKDSDYKKKLEKNFWGEPIRVLKKGRRWHLCLSDLPHCLVVDGQWIEQGEMGWWAIVKDKKADADWEEIVANVFKQIPDDAEVTLVDFHI